MKTKHGVAMWCGLVLFPLTLTAGYLTAKELRSDNSKYLCSETNPGSMCNANTQCGSRSTLCIADIKRTSDSASVTPSIPGAKANAPFCIRVGTTVTWQSSSKKTGLFWTSAINDEAGLTYRETTAEEYALAQCLDAREVVSASSQPFQGILLG